MTNFEIARIFYEIADILEIKSIEWKPIAYRKAAQNIETLSKDITEIYKKGGLKDLETIPSIGTHIAKKIEEYIKTGKIKTFEKLKKSIPKGLINILHLQGIGPKKVAVIYKKLKIISINDLEKAAKKGKIEKLAGFGKKSELEILKSINFSKSFTGRILISKSMPIAKDIISHLKKLKQVKKIELGGSHRRMRETIRDIDILIASSKPKPIMDFFTKLKEVKSVIAKGNTKSSIKLKSEIDVDLRVVEDKSFGSALQYFTGNKEHNIKLRQIAIKKGFKLSEYGLFKNKKYICGKTEKEIYNKLGMQYIPPEMRENRGEINLAIKKKLPKLIGYNDIKGDLHIHSTHSDGIHSPEEMVKTAIKMGYEYIGFGDHSRGTLIAGGMDTKLLLKYIKEIDKLDKKYKQIKIFKSAETNILTDGSLDYPDSILKKLDYVIAAIHFKPKSISKKELTKRITTGFENKYLTFFAHPTGRIINQRPRYPIDFNKVLDSAKQNNVWLEIDSIPKRIDLDDITARKAINKNIKLIINTDSHNKDHLKFMELGIATARRAWATKNDIINTLSLKKFEKLLKAKK